MPKFTVIAAFSLALASIAAAQNVGKKGFSFPENKGYTAQQLASLNVAWFYNWHESTKIKTTAQFVPMIFSQRLLGTPVKGDFVLGYNEPDHAEQANIPVEQAIKDWPKIAAKARFVGSPAMASNPVTGDWFPAFMKANPKVDFITVHWYKGPDFSRLQQDLTAIHNQYKKPLWITEYAAQTVSKSKDDPRKYSQQQVDQFIAQSTQWMEKTPWVLRYAWHDSKTGTSALFDEKGGLTATGKSYAAVRSGSK